MATVPLGPQQVGIHEFKKLLCFQLTIGILIGNIQTNTKETWTLLSFHKKLRKLIGLVILNQRCHGKFNLVRLLTVFLQNNL